MDHTWKVHARGRTADLTLAPDGLLLDVAGDVLRLPPEAWVHVQFPSSYAATLPTNDGGRLQVGFATRDEQKAFVAELTTLLTAQGRSTYHLAPTPRADLMLCTISEIPGRRISEVVGLVTAESVMSRGMFSDAGSDLKSVVGGNLQGMEKAIRDATVQATGRLARAASSLGADAVVGVSLSIAGVGDKAEAIVVTGTAVRTVSANDGPIEATPS